MSETNNQTLLAAGLLNVCKQLLGRVRVLEEVIQSNPELTKQWREQRRFQAALEEDEYKTLVSTMQHWLETLRDEDLLDEHSLDEHPSEDTPREESD